MKDAAMVINVDLARDTPPAQCPQCKVPAEKFEEVVEGERDWAAEHVVGIAKGVDGEVVQGLRDNFTAECTEVGMYLAMSWPYRPHAEIPGAGGLSPRP